MRTILVTVGTSLLSNAKRVLNVENPDPQQLANYLAREAPVRASAETNSLQRLLQEDDRLVFLCSQTPEGKQCATALESHYKRAGHTTQVVEVPDLTYADSSFKMRGLRSLVATLIQQIQDEKKQNRNVIINATGGFKAEITYATVVGLLFDVPVYYIHEAFRDIIELPPTPIKWDYSLIEDHAEFFEWIKADLHSTGEVNDRLRGLPEDIHVLLVEEEGYTSLSPTGEAFYDSYRYWFEQAPSAPTWLSNQAWKTYRNADASVRTRFERVLTQLSKGSWRGKADRVNKSDCLVWPKQHRDERIFFLEGDDGIVRVFELALHSDHSYENLLKRGVWSNNYPQGELWRP